MSKEHPSVFISYSWDSEEHENWVTVLAAKLRENGVDATIDKFETQSKTVNLNRMMIEKIKNSDNILLILTENYAKKADTFQGGVGYETNLLIQYIKDNPDKIILIMRHKGDYRKAVPFYLEGFHFINFSHDDQFDIKFDELLYRIYQVDVIDVPKVGPKPKLESKKIIYDRIVNETTNIIPNFKEITDLDKNKFMKQSYSKILSLLYEFAEQTKQKNNNFDYDKDIVHNQKTILRFYINGMEKYAVKIWLGNLFGGKNQNIYLSYGRFNIDSDNSFNDVVECEVTKTKDLKLKMTMNFMTGSNASDAYGIATEIWKQIVQYLNH
ncbi:toll/interleukin-1 receptor domain-containing protein [Calorimonas adulescens]|uniref:TIR domain-containing protein n=1 Tax=Calorimonas adulescens TaxID=2606906 RepID=A0A5D8QFM3_9THEO|nr:toll/interleukin-1 receptor domain-containing protein [Calorimonas adulescens]TZE82088.1 TIR domain-containing protein [Calorimonas adulescens]